MTPVAPAPCYLPVVIDSSGDITSVCHRLANHDGLCSDWAPAECLVEGCACTDVECAQCDEDQYRGIRTPHVCDPTYIAGQESIWPSAYEERFNGI